MAESVTKQPQKVFKGALFVCPACGHAIRDASHHCVKVGLVVIDSTGIPRLAQGY